jgi:glutathione S-transferase
MQLVYSHNSPYSRRARVAVRVCELLDRVEEVVIVPGPAGSAAMPWVTNYSDVTQLVAHGPAGKVPVLVTDSGIGLCESFVIARYLDGLSGGKLYPSEQRALERELRVEGLAAALMDSLFTRARENRREASLRSQEVVDLESARAARCLDALNGLVADISAHRIGGVATACALGYADWRHPDDGWRSTCAALAQWYEATISLAAYAETAIIT